MAPTLLEKAIEAEGAAGKSFGKQHGGFYEDEKILSLIFKPIDAYVKSLQHKEVRIADVGCGSGIVGLYVEQRLVARGYRVQTVFIDANQKMVAAIETAPHREVYVVDISSIPSEIKQRPFYIFFLKQFI